MKSLKYLEDLSKMTGKTDTETAKLLGISQGAFSNYRSGRRIMDDETCLAVANMLKVDPILVVAAACIDRAEKTGQRSLWETFLMGRMTAAAALLLAVSVNLFLTLPDAKAATLPYENANLQVASDLYYVKLRLKSSTVRAWRT